mgnify:CR=1 FL=1
MMMDEVEYRVKVDRQGRMVIPAPLRASLGLLGGGEVVVRALGKRLVIEVVDRDLERRVEEAVARILKIRAQPAPGKARPGKWYGAEYARRKLGL